MCRKQTTIPLSGITANCRLKKQGAWGYPARHLDELIRIFTAAERSSQICAPFFNYAEMGCGTPKELMNPTCSFSAGTKSPELL